MALPPPAWHPDPSGKHQLRYWDGQTWTPHVFDHGVQSQDPIGPPVGGAAGAATSQGGQAAPAVAGAQEAAPAAAETSAAPFQQAEAAATNATDSVSDAASDAVESVDQGAEAAAETADDASDAAQAATADASSDPAAAAGNLADQLERLAKLRDNGVLTQEEFDVQKAKFLGS